MKLNGARKQKYCMKKIIVVNLMKIYIIGVFQTYFYVIFGEKKTNFLRWLSINFKMNSINDDDDQDNISESDFWKLKLLLNTNSKICMYIFFNHVNAELLLLENLIDTPDLMTERNENA